MSNLMRVLSGKNLKDDVSNDGPSSASVSASRRGRSRSPLRAATKKGKSILGIITGESKRKKKRAKDAKEAALAVMKASSEEAKTTQAAGLRASADNSASPDLDDDETVYGVDIDSAAGSSKPTSPISLPAEDKTDFSSLSHSSSSEPIQIILLLMDPKTRRFEALQLDFDAHKTVVNDILDQIPLSATEESLRVREYQEICDRHGTEMTNSKPLSDYCKGGEVILAVAKDLTCSECAKLAKPILNAPGIMSMLGPSVGTDDFASLDEKDPAPKLHDVKTSASDNAPQQVSQAGSTSASKPGSFSASKSVVATPSPKPDSFSASKPDELSDSNSGSNPASKPDEWSVSKPDSSSAPNVDSAPKPESGSASKSDSTSATKQQALEQDANSEPELVPESDSKPVVADDERNQKLDNPSKKTSRLSRIDESPKPNKKKTSFLTFCTMSFIIISLLAIIVPLLMRFQESITAPLEPGDVLAPGEWRSKCGLLSFLPESYTGCDPKSIEMSNDGVVTLYHDRTPAVTFSGAVCESSDKECIPGAVFGKDGIIKIGGVPAKIAGEGAYSMSPWPVADSSFVQEKKKKRHGGGVMRLFSLPKKD